MQSVALQASSAVAHQCLHALCDPPPSLATPALPLTQRHAARDVQRAAPARPGAPGARRLGPATGWKPRQEVQVAPGAGWAAQQCRRSSGTDCGQRGTVERGMCGLDCAAPARWPPPSQPPARPTSHLPHPRAGPRHSSSSSSSRHLLLLPHLLPCCLCGRPLVPRGALRCGGGGRRPRWVRGGARGGAPRLPDAAADAEPRPHRLAALQPRGGRARQVAAGARGEGTEGTTY